MIVTAVKGRRMVILNRWSGQAPRGEVIVLAEMKGMICSGHYFRYLCFLWCTFNVIPEYLVYCRKPH